MLVADVFGGNGVDCILGHVRRVITDAFEATRDKNQV